MPDVVAPLRELGYGSSTGGNWWASEEEPAPELRWPLSVDVYDRMRRQDAQVASVLRAVTLPVRRTTWRIDPNGARPEVVQHVADDLGLEVHGKSGSAPTTRVRDRFSWSEHLRLALLMLPFGHSYFEQLYRIGDDGLAHLRKLAWRPPRSIESIFVAPDGGLDGIKQYAAIPGQDAPFIPVSHLVAYVHDREGGSWVGKFAAASGVQALAAEGPPAAGPGADDRPQRHGHPGLRGC
jgi:hypothetical protein